MIYQVRQGTSTPSVRLAYEPAARLEDPSDPGLRRPRAPYRLPDPTPSRPDPAFVAVAGHRHHTTGETLPPYLAHIGDIGITQTLVVTPSGTCARFRTRWTITDSTSQGVADHPSNDGGGIHEHRRFNAAMRVARAHLRRPPVRWLDVLVEGGGIRHLTRVTIESPEHEAQIRDLIATIEAGAAATSTKPADPTH